MNPAQHADIARGARSAPTERLLVMELKPALLLAAASVRTDKRALKAIARHDVPIDRPRDVAAAPELAAWQSFSR